MSLLTGSTVYGRTVLLELVRTQQEGLNEILDRIRAAEGTWQDPTSRLTAIDLLNDVRALSEGATAESTVSDAALLRVANVQYDAILAGIDLLKSHSAVPKVPRRSP